MKKEKDSSALLDTIFACPKMNQYEFIHFKNQKSGNQIDKEEDQNPTLTKFQNTSYKIIRSSYQRQKLQTMQETRKVGDA